MVLVVTGRQDNPLGDRDINMNRGPKIKPAILMHLVITAVYGQALGLKLELSNNCFNCCAEAHRIPPYSVVDENSLFLLTNSLAGEVARGR